MSGRLLTIGYQGTTLAGFVAALRAHGVEVLVDARDVPWSRKPGFSKPSLAPAIEKAGFVYVHLQALGNPAEGRDVARAGRRDEFERVMKTRLDSPDGQDALAEAASLATTRGPICLLCLERDPVCCHRAFVAARLKRRTRLAVRDLFP